MVCLCRQPDMASHKQRVGLLHKQLIKMHFLTPFYCCLWRTYVNFGILLT